MSLETSVVVRRRLSGSELPAAADVFTSRDYTLYQEYPVYSLSAGARTPIESSLASIEYLYIVSLSNVAVQLFKNRSPESYTFTGMCLMIGLSGIDEIALQSATDTTVHIYLAGS